MPGQEAKTIFADRLYLLGNYEPISLPEGSNYRRSAATQLGILRTLVSTPPEIVADLGCGTGNPTEYLLRGLPDAHIIGIDLSLAAIRIAHHKMGHAEKKETWQDFTKGIESVALGAIESHRTQSQRDELAARSLFVQADIAGKIPIANNSVDAVIGVQSIHWPPDTAAALREVGRILKPGGYFICDTSGLQMDYGEARFPGGELVNEKHTTAHPLHLKFIEKLNSLLKQEGLPELDPLKIDRFHRFFKLDELKDLAADAGLEIVELNADAFKEVVTGVNNTKATDGVTSLYSVTSALTGVEIKAPALNAMVFEQPVIPFIKNGGKMRYFNNPAHSHLTEVERQNLIDVALLQASTSFNDVETIKAQESLIYFVFRKKSSSK